MPYSCQYRLSEMLVPGLPGGDSLRLSRTPQDPEVFLPFQTQERQYWFRQSLALRDQALWRVAHTRNRRFTVSAAILPVCAPPFMYPWKS